MIILKLQIYNLILTKSSNQWMKYKLFQVKLFIIQ